jgi:hypothetical protein
MGEKFNSIHCLSLSSQKPNKQPITNHHSFHQPTTNELTNKELLFFIMGLQGNEFPKNMLHRKDFVWDNRDEPHLRRKIEILKKYPQIKELFGPDPQTKWFCFAVVFLQLLTCYLVKDVSSWTIFLLVVYVVGGTLNHSCTAAIHETTHCLVFEKQVYNYLMAIFVNLPIGLPVALSFKKYHHEHHQYQVCNDHVYMYTHLSCHTSTRNIGSDLLSLL